MTDAWAAALDQALHGDTSDECLVRLAIAGGPHEQDRLLATAGASTSRPSALWALGFSVHLRGAELCLDSMDDETCARLAGETFRAITGLTLAGPFVKLKPPSSEDEDEGEVEGAPAQREPSPGESELPLASARAHRALVVEERKRFAAGRRYLQGQPIDADGIRAALRTGPMRRQPTLALGPPARADRRKGRRRNATLGAPAAPGAGRGLSLPPAYFARPWRRLVDMFEIINRTPFVVALLPGLGQLRRERHRPGRGARLPSPPGRAARAGRGEGPVRSATSTGPEPGHRQRAL